jgi:hypothetical protein
MGSAIQAGGQGPEHPLTFRERPDPGLLDGFVRRPSPEGLRARLRQLRRATGIEIWLSADAARQVLRRVSLMGPRVAMMEGSDEDDRTPSGGRRV